jgi:hypothetical protein
MHDGAVVHDEQTAIGEVAATARKIMFTVPSTTEDDDLAGVSVLMKHVPHEPAAAPDKKAKTKARTSRVKTKKTKAAKK